MRASGPSGTMPSVADPRGALAVEPETVEQPVAPPRPKRRARRRRLPASEWAGWDDAQLLSLRLSDLDLRLEGSELEPRIAQLYSELAARGLRVPAPLLAVGRVVHARRRARDRHPVLPRAPASRAAGAAPDARGRGRHPRVVPQDPAPRGGPRHRERLRPAPPPPPPRALRQHLGVDYPEFYAPRPYSKSFVIHLDAWYAQSHPDEDFAETFAVWLDPESAVARALPGLAGPAEARVHGRADDGALGDARRRTTRPSTWTPLSSLRKTLRRHYEREARATTASTHPDFYDRDLRRLFSDSPGPRAPADRGQLPVAHPPRDAPAGGPLDERVPVHDRPGPRRHDRALPRAQPAPRGAPRARPGCEFAVLLTVQTMNYLHSGRHRVAL